MKNFLKNHFVFILVFAFVFFGLCYRVFVYSDLPFYDWDEAIYAQLAREIVTNASPWTTYLGSPWLEKPPLPHYITAFIFALFGENEGAARFSATIISGIILLLVYKISHDIITTVRSKPPSNHLDRLYLQLMATAPTTILASSIFFIDRASVLNVDVWLGLGWIGYFAFWKNTRAKLFFLILAVSSKSLLGFFPLIIDVMCNPRSFLRPKELPKLIALVLVPLWWHFAAFLKYGQLFISSHLLDHLVSRVAKPVELHMESKWFYFRHIWSNFTILNSFVIFAYSFFGIDSLKTLRSRTLKGLNSKHTAIFVTALLMLLFLTISKTKLHWYLYPILPLLAVCTSYTFARLHAKLATFIASLTIVYCLVIFTPQVIVSAKNNLIQETTQLGLCIQKFPTQKVFYLQSKQGRQDNQVFRAANVQIGSSFIYGGAPAFVFYANKPILFFDNISNFTKQDFAKNLIVITKEDVDLIEIKPHLENKVPVCESGAWLAFQM